MAFWTNPFSFLFLFYLYLLKLNLILKVPYYWGEMLLNSPLDLIRWFASCVLPTNAALNTERMSCSVCATSATSLYSNRNVSLAPSALNYLLMKNKQHDGGMTFFLFRLPVDQLRLTRRQPRLLETEPRLVSTGSWKKRSQQPSKRWRSLRAEEAPLWLAHSDLTCYWMGLCTRLLGVSEHGFVHERLPVQVQVWQEAGEEAVVCHQRQGLVHIRCQWGENWLPPRFFYVAVHVKLYSAYLARDPYILDITFWPSSRRTLRPWRVSLCLALNWGPNRHIRCSSSSTTKRRSISFLKQTMSKRHRGTALQDSLLNSHILWQKSTFITHELPSFPPSKQMDWLIQRSHDSLTSADGACTRFDTLPQVLL